MSGYEGRGELPESAAEEGPIPMAMPGSESEGAGVQKATVNPSYLRLRTAWQQEEACPEVLAWEHGLYTSFIQMIEQQEKMIEETRAQGAGVEAALFVLPLYEQDLQRVKFVLTAYVRARLRKILRQAGHLAADPDAWARLSPHEKRFCDRYLGLLHRHHRAALLRDLPDKYADAATSGNGDDDDVDDACPATLAAAITRPPDLAAFVFCNVLSDLGDVPHDDHPPHETTHMAKGDTHVIRYKCIRSHVNAGDIELF